MKPIETKVFSGHPCISFECIEVNNTSDFDVETNVSFQMLMEWEMTLKEEEKIIKKYIKNDEYETI